MPSTGRSIVCVTGCYVAFVITTLLITGMTCNHCMRSVGDVLRAVPGVTQVAVELAGRVEVVHDDGTPLASLVSAVQSAGYEARHA